MKDYVNVVLNRSAYPTDELMPLLRLAWETVSRRRIKITRKINLVITRPRTNTWYFRWNSVRDGTVAATLCFAAPDKARFPTSVAGLAVVNMNEVIVACAAWAFAVAMGVDHASCTSSALYELKTKAAAVEARIAAIRQRKVEAENAKFARCIFNGMERNTLDFKLAKLDKSERMWQRKLRLATTKLRTLNSRKSALRAADARKKRLEPLVTL